MQTQMKPSAAAPANPELQTSMPSLAMFMQRHRLSEEAASRVLQVAHNIDKADAIAELMR